MKLIIAARENDWSFALCAAKQFLDNPETNCAIIVIEGIKFLVTKNKSSISVRSE